MFETFRAFFSKNLLSSLLLMYFVLLPFGRSTWVPLVIMSVLGVMVLIRDLNNEVLTEGLKWLLFAALSIYVPACVSTFNSISPERTLRFIILFPCMFFVGYYIFNSIVSNAKLDNFFLGLLGVVVFWSITVFMQFAHLTNYFGGDPEHIQGIHSRYAGGGLLLGVISASLLPLLSGYYLEKKKYGIVLFVTILMTVLIFASGTRSAWLMWLIMFALTLILLSFYFNHLCKENILKIIAAVLLTLSIGVLIVSSTGVITRVFQTMQFFHQPSVDSFDRASGGRFIIWRDAFNIGLKYPVSGSGANTFRYAQPLVAKDDSHIIEQPWNKKHPKVGGFHTHQIILEVWSGSGAIGLLGIIMFYMMLMIMTKQVLERKSWLALGAIIGLWAGFFPLNTHNNFYGSWMTGWLWIWLGLSVGLLQKIAKDCPEATGRTQPSFDK